MFFGILFLIFVFGNKIGAESRYADGWMGMAGVELFLELMMIWSVLK